MKLVFNTHVKRLEERRWITRAWKDPQTNETKTMTESRGWWLVLDGLSEAIWVGSERPDIIEGQYVQLTIESQSAE